MEQFSSLKRKVCNREAPTARILFWYNDVPKTAMYSKNDRVGGWELKLVFFRRAISAQKRIDLIVIARILHHATLNYYLRWWCMEALLSSRVSCRKLISSTKKRCILDSRYAPIDYALCYIANLCVFTFKGILRPVKLGHSIHEREYWGDCVSLTSSCYLNETLFRTIWSLLVPNSADIFFSAEKLFQKVFISTDETKTL